MSAATVPFHRVIDNTIYGARTPDGSDAGSGGDGLSDSFWFDLGAPVEPADEPVAPVEAYAPLALGSGGDELAAPRDGEPLTLVSDGDGFDFF